MAATVIDLTTLSAAEGFIIVGDAPADLAGYSVSTAGDINGDGIDDIIVGAPRASNVVNDTSEAYIIFGKPGATRANINISSLAAADGFIISQDGVNTGGLGYSVSGAGDVNGDGIDDLIVGAPRSGADGSGSQQGESYVVFGKAGATRAEVDLDALSASDGFAIRGDAANDYAGRAVSGAGDVNGDGIDDVIVGAWRGDDGGNQAGEAYVIFGKAGATRANIDLTTLAASDGFIVIGDAPDDTAGRAVSSAGDVNGDGIDDILVGAQGGDDGGTAAGEVYVVFGKAGATRANIDLTTLAASDGFIIQGDDPFDSAGWSVSEAGDVNGDGFDDLILGAFRADTGNQDAGEAYVIFGKAGATRANIDLASLASDGFKIRGSAYFEEVGWSVGSAGDVNGDGLNDVIVGAPYNIVGKSGQAYVVFGKAGATRADINLATLAATDGLLIQGDAAGDYAGISVAGAGDINGDGFDDVIVGAPRGNDGGNDAGEAYVIFGKASFVTSTPPDAVGDTANVNEDASITINVLANDSDPGGGALDVTTASDPAHGTAVVNGNDTITYTPDPNYQGKDSFTYTIANTAGATDTATVSVTVQPLNDAPVVAATQAISTGMDVAKPFTVSASDADGDPLSYTAGAASHGSVAGGAAGAFTYTPAAGFVGSDSFTIGVSDGKGGNGQQLVSVLILPDPGSDWRLVASDGFAGKIGGSGAVFGTTPIQDITLLDLDGTVSFDPSFNRGGDIVRLAGDASDWQIARFGSSAIFSDGDTFASLPVGTAGMAVVFDDGARTLKFNTAQGSFTIGSQAFAGTLVQITAAPDGTVLPTGADPAASARLFLASDAAVTAGGVLNVFGTNGAELVSVLQGDVGLDPSFNRGGDVLELNQPAPNFTAVRAGSSIQLDSASLDVVIPLGANGMTLDFTDGPRTLIFDTVAGSAVIGSQQIGLNVVALSEFG